MFREKIFNFYEFIVLVAKLISFQIKLLHYLKIIEIISGILFTIDIYSK